MRQYFYQYLQSGILFFLLSTISSTSFSQLLPRYTDKTPLIEKITPQFVEEKDQRNFNLSREMEDLLNYSQVRVNPMKRNMSTDQFIDRYYPYFDTRLMRNGDIAYLKFYYHKYLNTLKECLAIANPQGLEFTDSRRDFFKNSTLATRKEKRRYWRKFYDKRAELVANFYFYRQYIVPAISTEIAMILQEEHFPELAQSMNDLENLDGTPLEVAIYSNRILAIPEKKDTRIAGLSIISKCENIFTSGSPAVRDAYPGLRGSNKGLTVHLRLFEDGVTLSHELGHLYYLYHKWEEYVAYIRRKGKDYEPGGHGPDDPSGLAAKMTEEGKMPF